MAKKRANNEGTITKRADGRWEGKIIVGLKPDGSPDRKSVYGRTQKEAKEKLEELKSDLRSGTYAAPSDVKVGEWLRAWVNDYAQVSTRLGTYKKYHSLIENHIVPTIGNLKLQDLKTSSVQKLFAVLLKSGNTRTKKGLSAATVAEIHLILNQACKQAIICNLIRRNPVDGTKKPTREKPEINPYTEDELDQFLKTVKDHIHYPAYFLNAYSGLRRGELLGLKWNNVDFKTNSISIIRSVKANKNEKTHTKTKSSMRTIPVGKKVMLVLQAHKEKQDALKTLLGDSYIDNGLVFCQESGKQLCPRSFCRSFERALAHHKLRKIRFHDLRHTHATILLMKGVPVHVVSARLGHSSIRVTLDFYSHIVPGIQDQVAELLDQMIDDSDPDANAEEE